MSQISLLVVGGVSAAIWLAWRVLAKASSSGANASLEQLPLVKFEENDVPQRYISETGKLLRDGYRKVRHIARILRIVEEEKLTCFCFFL